MIRRQPLINQLVAAENKFFLWVALYNNFRKVLARAFLILNCKTLTICDNHMLNRKLMWKDLREIRRRRWFSGLVSKIRCRRKFSEIFDYVSPRKTLLEANSRRALPACQSSANFSPIARQRVSRGSFCSPIGGANNAATLQSGQKWPESQFYIYIVETTIAHVCMIVSACIYDPRKLDIMEVTRS